MEELTFAAASEAAGGVMGEALPLLLTMEQAARRLGIGRTKLYELVAAGEVESVPVGRLRRVPAECLEEYVGRLRASSNGRSPAA